jgi:AmiR/NasT family two-component response regulator
MSTTTAPPKPEPAMTGAVRSTSTLLFLQRRIAASSPADPFTEILSRKEVHQATRIILARRPTGAEDALLHMRAHAHATGTTVRAVAHAILIRRLDPALFDCDSH